MPDDINLYEGEDKGLPFTMTYSNTYSIVNKRSTPVLQADVARVYFYVKAQIDTSPFLSLSDADSTQIEWTGPTTGDIVVHFPGTGTASKVANGQFYELRVKIGTKYLTVESGKINILDSTVDRP